MNVMMVRAKIKEENVADTQAATEKVIQALKQAQPDVHYAVTRLSDGVTVLAFLEMEPGQEGRLAADQVGQPPAEQQQAPERQRRFLTGRLEQLSASPDPTTPP